MLTSDVSVVVVLGAGSTGIGIVREAPVMDFRFLDRPGTPGGRFDGNSPDAPQQIPGTATVALQFLTAESVDCLIAELLILKQYHFGDKKEETK